MGLARRCAMSRGSVRAKGSLRRASISSVVAQPSSITIRRGDPRDLDDIGAMVGDFARDHPAANHRRPHEALHAALFGPEPVARIFVATWGGRVVGMAQWTRTFDMFWGVFGGKPEWLYVRPEARGLGISAALVAAICDDVRRSEGEFLYAGYDERLAPFYERVAIGWPTRECHLSAEAFQVLADLAGKPPREIVRGLPAPELNRSPVRSRR